MLLSEYVRNVLPGLSICKYYQYQANRLHKRNMCNFYLGNDKNSQILKNSTDLKKNDTVRNKCIQVILEKLDKGEIDILLFSGREG